MQRCIIVAAALAAVTAPVALSATAAQAEEWCGYALHPDAVIQCGYTTVADCQTAVGKGGMCFVDPELALNARRATLSPPARVSPQPAVAAQRS